MRKSHGIFVAFVLASLLFGIVPALQAEKDAAPSDGKTTIDQDVRTLLKLTRADQLGTQVADAMIAQFKATMPNIPNDFWDAFRDEMKPEELVDLVVPIYAKHFTQDDIRGLIAFHKTPLGQKLIDKQPLIMQESMATGRLWGMRLGQRAMQKIREKGAGK
jgi:uncharacterized protein